MKKSILNIEISAYEVDGKEVIKGAPTIVFECDDFGLSHVWIIPHPDFNEKRCMVFMDDLINLGDQLRAFKNAK